MRTPFMLATAAAALSVCVPSPTSSQATVELPKPRLTSDVSVEAAIAARRSVRTWRPGALTLAEASQLLWAAQGTTNPEGTRRAVPSAGARYPLDLYAVVVDVRGIEPGVYRYVPESHQLLMVTPGDPRAALTEAGAGQASVASAPFALVIAADYARITPRYGERAERYTAIETGGVMENVYLQARALGLGTVAVGAFRDAAAQALVGCAASQPVLLLLPVGRL